jgi:hypothetical protein
LEVLQLLVATTNEDPINRSINPNRRFSHSNTLQYFKLLCVYYKYRRKCNNFIFVVLCLSSFTLHVSAVTGHHQVYFHLRSCHTARKLKFKTTSSLNCRVAFNRFRYTRISLLICQLCLKFLLIYTRRFDLKFKI